MGLFKSIIGGGYTNGELEQDFCEYSETFGKQPALVTCDLNFMETLPNNQLSCCVKIQMDVYIRPELPTLIAESEASYISSVRASLLQHIGGVFVGQGIIGSSGTVFLMFYIPERTAGSSKKMLAEVFMGSFRHVETSFVYDPDGLQYKKYLYPNELQKKKSDNMKILKSLRTYGDDGSIPRPVKFNLIFASRNDALACYSDSMAKGFQFKDLVSEPTPEGMVLPRYRLILEKTVPFNIDLLTLIDGFLMKISEAHNGEYRSLETDVLE